LVNLPAERIELYAAPAGGAYQTVKHYQRGEDVRAHTIPDLSISVADVLG
jgi:hypothetical protein